MAAAIALARAEQHVIVVEGAESPGGGTRTLELTLPGFLHDVCVAVTPLALGSPFFSGLELKKKYGLTWTQPPIPLAHPIDGGESVYSYRELNRTAMELGSDRSAYLHMFVLLVGSCPELMPALLAPLHIPRHPIALACFGLQAI